MAESPGDNSTERDPFYVGYLPLPRAIRRFLVPWLAGNFVMLLGVAVVVAQQHRDPGDGAWDTGNAVTIEGRLAVSPYPLLHEGGATYILVEQGKRGVQDRLDRDKIEAGRVRVTGFLIERDGRTVLELDGSLSNPIASVGANATTRQTTLVDRDQLEEVGTRFNDGRLGIHTLVGEIVDPKCYLGVMQPGDGKTHKVCATLCISGGIPPMFLVRNEAGVTAAYLLTDAEGGPFPASHHEYIADPVELTGRVYSMGDLLILRADLSTIHRLGPGQ